MTTAPGWDNHFARMPLCSFLVLEGVKFEPNATAGEDCLFFDEPLRHQKPCSRTQYSQQEARSKS